MTTTMFSGEMINEKEALHGLNDRFAGFIEKVRHLERQNQLLESEIREMKERRRSPSSLEEEHGAELAELRRLLRDVTQQKHRVEVEHQSLEEELARLGTRYEGEARGRADAEGGIAALKRDIGDAYQAKVQLDKKAQSLVDDVDFLKKSHEAEVSRMAAQVQEAEAQQAHHHVDFGKADLTAALRDIRAQLEGHATSDLGQADEGFRAQFARLTEAAESKREALRASQQEVQECRRSLQAKSMELDCNRGTRDALERQLGEVEDRHNDDIIHYQDTIKELENELISAKFDMSAHLREYQDLLNVKMELDVEILSYRKLLEGEETRLSAPVSMPYIYRQSPVHTLPCLGRPGGPGKRAEQPQYKFVEEIITETTREIEMSEFEESGSGESPDAGRAEEEACDDSQQNQVESAGRSEQGDNEVEEESAMDKAEVECQAESTENNDKPESTENNDKPESTENNDKPESTENNDKPESTENNDKPTAESAHSEEVRSFKATGTLENEPRDSAANVNGQMGSNAVMTSQAVQKDAAAKAADSKVEESEEVKMTESEVDKKVGALKESEESDVKDNVDTAQAKMLKDESSAKCPTDSHNVQVSSIVDKLHGEAPSLPTETMEKITDLTVALSMPLPKDTLQPEKQNKETPSVVPRGEEREDRITESMAACNKADAVKSPIGHKVAKGIEKAADDADKEKDKSASVKSEPAKLEGEKSDSGDKTHTVEPTFPKERIAVTEENKDTKQGLPDRSKTQESSIAIDKSSDLEKDKRTADKSDMPEPPKGDGEKPNTGDNTQTVEATSPKEKIALTAETKDPQEGAPDNSKTQKPSNGKLEDEKSDSEDKTHTVEPIFQKEKIAVTEKSKDSSQTQEQSNATDSEKDKHTVAKSDMVEPPKLEGEKSISEDKTQTLEPIFPKEKIAVTEENKDTKQGLADSSKTQEPSNAIDDASDLEKDKRTAAKSDMTEPPKGDGEKPNAGDNTQTVDATSPKEKIALTAAAETKDRQEAPDNSKTQKPSNGKLEDEKSDSGDKTHTVEPIFPKEKIAVTEESKDSSQTQEPSNATDSEKDKHTVAKSDMAEPPKLEGEKSISEDKTQTVEPIFPKEKIAVSTVENKDTKQGLPDSSKTQEPSIAIDESSDLEKDKRTAAKSDMAEPPKGDGEKPNAGDNTQTVDATSPKEKIALTAAAETKDRQEAPDNSKTQKPSNGKLEDEKSDSEDKTHTVEPIFLKEKIALTEESKDSSQTQEQSNATDSEKDKHTVAKSDMAEPPKLDGEKSVSEDKPQTVEPIFPKEKIAVTEENKDTKQGVPDSSKTQEPSIAIDDASDIDKRTAAKSDMPEPPKGDGEKPNTGDNTQTVDATSPKEKIALTAAAETKDPQEGAPDNSKTQKPSNGKLEDEKSDSGDKTHTVEPIFPKEKIAVTEESKDSSQTQEQSNATDSEKDKHTVAKSDMTEPPKVDGEKSVSEDKPQTVEPIFPKEKIAVTEESKDSSQTTDSEKDKHTVAKSDMTEPPKLEGEKSISGDKTQTVEPVFPKEKIAVTEKSKVSQLDSSKTQEPSNAIEDASDLENDKRTAAISDMTEPPKGDGEKPNTGDNTHTVEATSPKEKIALTAAAETKDPQEGAPDNSKTQKPSNGKLEDEKSDSGDKTHTVEPTFPKEKIAVTEESKDSSQTQESSIAIDKSSDLEKDKHTVAKSDMAEPPKLEGEVSISEDKPQTVEPIFPKEKIAVTEENKDAKQPDGSKSQEPSKVPETINNAKEKEEMLKDSAKNKDSGKTTENITEPIDISETKTEPIEISETKTTSQKEPGTSTVSLTAKTVGGLMSEAAKPKTENGFSNGIGGIKAEDNEPIKAVPQLGEAAKEKTKTSI